MTDPDRRRFRTVLSNYPTGVCLVTAVEPAGAPVGMVVGTFTSVSLDPALVAFLPGRASTTWPRIRAAGSFCINVLAADQAHLCQQFAQAADDRFAGVEWRPGVTGAPVIEGVVARVDCVLEAVHDAGDHQIAIGRVAELQIERETEPLLFWRGGLRTLAVG